MVDHKSSNFKKYIKKETIGNIKLTKYIIYITAGFLFILINTNKAKALNINITKLITNKVVFISPFIGPYNSLYLPFLITKLIDKKVSLKNNKLNIVAINICPLFDILSAILFIMVKNYHSSIKLLQISFHIHFQQ